MDLYGGAAPHTYRHALYIRLLANLADRNSHRTVQTQSLQIDPIKTKKKAFSFQTPLTVEKDTNVTLITNQFVQKFIFFLSIRVLTFDVD